MLRLRVAAAVVVVAAACGDTTPPELRTAAEPSAVVLYDLPRPSDRPAPTTTTTTAPSTTTTAPSAPTTTTAPSPVEAAQSASAQTYTGDCLGWGSTIAAHFPPAQHAKACAVMSCETGGTGDPTIYNRSGSGASGLWQFMPDTWERTTGLPPPAANYSGDAQTAAAAKLWRSSGWGPWSCA